MRPTLSNSWKFLTSKLHQPLPLNRRESQRLLTLLNDSFKRNLDRHYPPGLADIEQSPDEHFQTLFKSPLFGPRGRRVSVSERKTTLAYDAAQIRDMMFAVKEPVEYFREQVATGTATVASANFALENQTKKALASASVNIREGMGSTGMGSVIANWLWTSGQYEHLDFIKDRHFMARLLPFLVAEGQYKQVWEWLQRAQAVIARGKDGWLSPHKDLGFVIRKLVQAEVSCGQGLQSAIQMFLTNLRSMRSLHPSMHLSSIHKSNSSAGTFLLLELASQGHSSDVDITVIDTFDHSVNFWVSRNLAATYKALFQLVRPQGSSSVPALRLISTLESSESQLSNKERLALIPIGLKAVEFLLDKDSVKEASQVMKMMQLTFTSELGSEKKPSSHEKQDEEAVLRSLNLTLAI